MRSLFIFLMAVSAFAQDRANNVYECYKETVLSAAAEVLTHFFSDHGERRTTMAREASDSRLLGGIHFGGDNDEGFILGQTLAKAAISALR